MPAEAQTRITLHPLREETGGRFLPAAQGPRETRCGRTWSADIASGILVPTTVPAADWHAKARELSDRYSPTVGTRSLDLLRVVGASRKDGTERLLIGVGVGNQKGQ